VLQDVDSVLENLLLFLQKLAPTAPTELDGEDFSKLHFERGSLHELLVDFPQSLFKVFRLQGIQKLWELAPIKL